MRKNVFIIGFALFAIMFGAGNVIFPVQIGAKYGSHWVIPFIGFSISELLITLWSFSIINRHQSIDKLGILVHKNFVHLFYGIFVLSLIFIFIPRTAATSYEMFIVPYFPHLDSFIFYIIYFTACFFFIINPSKLLTIIGKYLSPLLILMLFYGFVSSFFRTPPPANEVPIDTFLAFRSSFFSGYQTGDALATLIPWALMVSMLSAQGLKTVESRKKTIFYASLLSVVLLGVVYLMLAYLGSVASSVLDTQQMTTTQILATTFQETIGATGSFILSMIILLACFTTAIGTTSVSVAYFAQQSRKKYSIISVIILIIATLMSLKGVDKLILIAGPLLEIIYTALILMLFLNTFRIKSALTHQLTVYTGLLFNTLDILYTHFNFSFLKIIKALPFYESHFSWVVPTVLIFGLSLIFTKKPHHKTNEDI